MEERPVQRWIDIRINAYITASLAMHVRYHVTLGVPPAPLWSSSASSPRVHVHTKGDHVLEMRRASALDDDGGYTLQPVCARPAEKARSRGLRQLRCAQLISGGRRHIRPPQCLAHARPTMSCIYSPAGTVTACMHALVIHYCSCIYKAS